MAGFLLKRFLNTMLVLIGVVPLSFCLIRFPGGDPATIIALDKYGSTLISNEVIERLVVNVNHTVWCRYADSGTDFKCL